MRRIEAVSYTVWPPFASERGDHQRRDSCTRTPAVAFGRRHVLPPAPQAVVTQALAALERVLRTLLDEVVERLVVVLEVWNLRKGARVFELVQGGLPGTGVPGPVDVLFAQFVANVLVGLGHQHAGQIKF